MGRGCCSRHGPRHSRAAARWYRMHDLNRSMDSGIGATGAGRNNGMAGDAGDRAIDLVLGRPPVRLALPALENRAIVFQAKRNPGQDNHQQIGNRAAITDRSATPSGLRSMRTEGSNGSRGGWSHARQPPSAGIWASSRTSESLTARRSGESPTARSGAISVTMPLTSREGGRRDSRMATNPITQARRPR